MNAIRDALEGNTRELRAWVVGLGSRKVLDAKTAAEERDYWDARRISRETVRWLNNVRTDGLALDTALLAKRRVQIKRYMRRAGFAVPEEFTTVVDADVACQR